MPENQGSTQKYGPFALAMIVQNEIGNILLRLRQSVLGEQVWEIFAGYPEQTELPKAAIERILFAKAGIKTEDIVSIDFTGNYYDQPNRHPGHVCVPLLHIVIVKASTISLGCTHWFTSDELSELTYAFDNREMLSDTGFIT